MENVKEISRENDLYKKIIDILLNNSQFKRICEKSRYIEDDDKWKISPFSMMNDTLNFANVKPSQVETFIEGNLAKRELVIDDVINDSSKNVIFQNYGDENFASKENDKVNRGKLNIINNRINKKENDDKRINLRVTKDKFIIDAGNESNQKESFIKKPISDNSQNGGINLLLMNQKERQKFEELSNLSNSKNKYGDIFRKGNGGKIFLNPLNGQNLNKVEVSFKATLDLNNLPPAIGNRNKIKLANISEDDY